jgi:hypothetical protein
MWSDKDTLRKTFALAAPAARPPSGHWDIETRSLPVFVERVLSVTLEAGRLFARPTQGPKAELFPISETTFVRQDSPLRLTFTPRGRSSSQESGVRRAPPYRR